VEGERHPAGKFFTVLVVSLILVPAAASAFNPVDQSAWEIPRTGAPGQLRWDSRRIVSREEGLLGAPARVEALAAFAREFGDDWYYQVNRATGTFHHVYGRGVDLGRRIESARSAEEAATDFIRSHTGLFGVETSDLRVARNSRGLGKRSVVFQQTYGGLKVWGGRAHIVFTEAGRMFAFGADTYPGIDIPTDPSLAEGQALGIAKSDLGFAEGSDRVTHRELVILPVEREEALEYRLAYRFDLRTESPFGLWATYVDADTGEILWRENHIRFADFEGHAQGDVEWDGYCDGYTTDYRFINMQVDITGAGTVYTDENGDFVVSYGGTDPASISAELRGPWVNVDIHGGGDASHSGTIVPGTPYTIDWDATNSIDSERDVFAYVNREHDWLKAIDPDYTGMDYEMTAWVERTDGYCPGNAWWDGSTINLCVGNATYGNTGRMGDVVYHEYGHGVTDFLYGPNDPPSDMHEANSDIIANYLTRESIMGLGFYLDNCSSGIRDSDNSMQYPCSGGGHYCGQVLAGFHWDSWQELLGVYSQDYADSVAMHTWHFGRSLGLPQNQQDQVTWTFIADDTDGNLANGTPHYDQFCVGAMNHSFSCPEITQGVFISHAPLEDTGDTGSPYTVTAVITSTEGSVDVGACRVTYRVDGGGLVDLGMSSTGNPDEYSADIPAQSSCSLVEYYIHAEDTMGNTADDPLGAPATLHSFTIGYETVFEDDFEADRGWTAGLPGDDATTGQWERCNPEGTEAQAEDDHTADPGTNAYITECAAGSGQGTYDIDNGVTTLESPVFDLSGYDQAVVSYYRWYSNDTGAEPGTDYWVVRVTDDGWATYQTLENTNVSDRSWSKKEFRLEEVIGLTDQVQLRFLASDEDPGSLVEAGVDDFRVMGCSSASDTEPPVVTVTDPNGGETIIGGVSPYTIRWASDDNVGVAHTHILLSTDGGSTYPDTLASLGSDSTWAWDAPDSDMSACRIKVACLDAAGNQGEDESDGDFEVVGTSGIRDESVLPGEVTLSRNRPSPSTGYTEIVLGLPRPQRVDLAVYNIEGRRVAGLAEGVYPEGYHNLTWRGTDSRGRKASPGVYFFRLVTEDRKLNRKMLLVR
jgi:Zn-dependent metalloprotease